MPSPEKMDKEAEDDYNKRQAAPLFQTAKAMISTGEIEERNDAYRCGHHKKYGCKIPKRHPVFPWCVVCKMLMAVGTDFFAAEKEVNQDEVFQMNPWQQEEHARLQKYWESWLENYPNGATSGN